VAEYHTVKFTNDAEGIRNKNEFTGQMAAEGWRIASELIEQGHIKGGEACCGALICLPFGFLAGRTPSVITVTFVRETTELAAIKSVQTWAGKIFCAACGQELPQEAKFCVQCGAPNPTATAIVRTISSGRNNKCLWCGARVGEGITYCFECRAGRTPPNAAVARAPQGGKTTSYYVVRQSEQYGPYSFADLQRYLREGNLAPSDMVRSEGMEQLTPVLQILGKMLCTACGQQVPQESAFCTGCGARVATP
jgi:hypothetical protein